MDSLFFESLPVRPTHGGHTIKEDPYQNASHERKIASSIANNELKGVEVEETRVASRSKHREPQQVVAPRRDVSPFRDRTALLSGRAADL